MCTTHTASFVISQPPYASIGPFATREDALTWLHSRQDMLGTAHAQVLACYTPGSVELAYVELANAEATILSRAEDDYVAFYEGRPPVHAIGDALTGDLARPLPSYRPTYPKAQAPAPAPAFGWFTPVRHALALLLRGRA